MTGAGEAVQEMLPAAVPPLQTSKAPSELHTIRKRQSFNFGDNRLGPAMLTGQTDTQLPTLSGAVLPAASDTTSRPGFCAASAATSLPASSLAAGVTQSADISATDNSDESTPSGQPDVDPSMPSMSDGTLKHPVPVAAGAAVAHTAEKTDPLFTNSGSSLTLVAGSKPVDSSRGKPKDILSKPGDIRGKAAARAGSTAAPAVASKPGHSHTAKSPKTLCDPQA